MAYKLILDVINQFCFEYAGEMTGYSIAMDLTRELVKAFEEDRIPAEPSA